MKPKKVSEKTLAELPRKLIRYAELLATGTLSITQAALQAGYKHSVADKVAYQWLGKTREESQYPHLWDYYEKLRTDNLRLYGVTIDSVVNELRTIAFSDITAYIDLPSIEDQKREALIERIQHAQNKVFVGMADELEEELVEKYPDDKLDELIAISRMRPGSTIRLKSREEIPKELLPAIAEIHETREGIRVKLHNKLDALDKLARWLKMYQGEKDSQDEPIKSVEINLNVNGSRSRLMGTDQANSAAA